MSCQGCSIGILGTILTTGHVGTHERHESFYDWAFITRYLGGYSRPKPIRGCVAAPTSFPPSTLADFRSPQFWGAEIEQDPPTVKYGEVMDSEGGMGKMTSLLV